MCGIETDLNVYIWLDLIEYQPCCHAEVAEAKYKKFLE